MLSHMHKSDIVPQFRSSGLLVIQNRAT